MCSQRELCKNADLLGPERYVSFLMLFLAMGLVGALSILFAPGALGEFGSRSQGSARAGRSGLLSSLLSGSGRVLWPGLVGVAGGRLQCLRGAPPLPGTRIYAVRAICCIFPSASVEFLRFPCELVGDPASSV